MKKIALIVFAISAIAFQAEGQYTDQLNNTPDKIEYTFNYNWDTDTLVSVTVIQDSLWDNYGYAGYEFKKYDSNFNVTLTKRQVDTNYWYVFGRSMAYNRGGYYVTAQKRTAYNQNDTAFACIVKFDSSGNKIWDKIYYDSLGGDMYTKYVVSHDSLIVFAGSYYDTTQTGYNRLGTFLTAIDTSGLIVWNKFFLGYNLQPVNLKKTSDGGFLLTTYTQVTAANDTRVYKLDHLGNIQWERTIGNGIDSYFLAAEEAPDGNVICYGSKTVGNDKSYLVKLNSSGVIIHDTVYELNGVYTNYFNYESNSIMDNDGIYISGAYFDSVVSLKRTFLTFVNYNLDVQWIRLYNKRTYNDIINYMCPYKPSPEFIAMCGLSFSDDSTNTNDEWFLVVDSLGCTVQGCSVGITELELHNQYMSVYPNPSNGSFTIVLDAALPSGEVVITDLSGKQIEKVLVSNQVNIDLSKLSEGIYIVHLQTGAQIIETQKIVIQK